MSLLKFKNGNVWSNLQLGVDNIAANAINASKIVDGSIGTAELANNAVTSAKIADGTIVAGDLSAALLKRITDLEKNFKRVVLVDLEFKSESNVFNGMMYAEQNGHLVYVSLCKGMVTLPPWLTGYQIAYDQWLPNPKRIINAAAQLQNHTGSVVIFVEDNKIQLTSKTDQDIVNTWIFANFVYFTDDLSKLGIN